MKGLACGIHVSNDMNPLNRREMLRQTAAGLTSFFIVGRLQYDAVHDQGQDELYLAAATSFEFITQKLFIPYGRTPGKFEIPSSVLAKGYELTRLLNPSNAPPIFVQAQVLSRDREIVVQFCEHLSVSLPPGAIGAVRRSLTKHPNVWFDVTSMSATDVVKCYLSVFKNPQNWKYD